jgi:hypothetical protein
MNAVSLNPQISSMAGSTPIQTISQSVPYNDHDLSIGNKPTLEQPLQPTHNKQKTLPEYSISIVHAPITTDLG